MQNSTYPKKLWMQVVAKHLASIDNIFQPYLRILKNSCNIGTKTILYSLKAGYFWLNKTFKRN